MQPATMILVGFGLSVLGVVLPLMMCHSAIDILLEFPFFHGIMTGLMLHQRRLNTFGHIK
jgi:hypothetical protein